MATTAVYPFYELIELLVETAPERVLDFHASEGTTKRVYALIEKEKEGKITLEEKKELDRYLLEESLINIAKARAWARLVPK